jgi:hypothetical protein
VLEEMSKPGPASHFTAGTNVENQIDGNDRYGVVTVENDLQTVVEDVLFLHDLIIMKSLQELAFLWNFRSAGQRLREINPIVAKLPEATALFTGSVR